MDSFLRRRGLMQTSNPWTLLEHNNFDKYLNYKPNANGETFVVKDGGNWVEIVSNGKNTNTTQFIWQPRVLYNDYKDKRMRFTWTIECDSDPSLFDGTNASGNVGLGLFSTSTGDYRYRKSKHDIGTYSNFIGHHVVEIVPSQWFAGYTLGDWLGWNFGARTSVVGYTLRIMQMDVEVMG